MKAPAPITSSRRSGRHAGSATRRRIRRASLAIVVLVAVWQLLPTVGGVNPFLMPPPIEVAKQLSSLAGPESLPAYALWYHIFWSVFRLLAGVALGCIVGVPIGLAMGVNKYIRLGLRPLLTLMLSVPSLALAPILILFLGLNNKVPVTVIAIETVILMAYNAEVGASSVPSNMKWALASMGASRLTIFRRVVLPASIPSLVTAMKLSVGYGWRALIAVEAIAATTYGLGFMIFEAQSYMNTRTIFAGIVSIAMVGLVLERVIFGRFERRINSWYAIQAKEK